MRFSPRTSVVLVLVATGLVQGLTYLARPFITYAALDAGISTGTVGVIGAAYAAVALLIAIPMGKWNDSLGAWPLFVAGAGLMCVAVLVLTTTPGSALVLAAVGGLLGAGHLACTVAGQSAVAAAAGPGRLDAAFGHFTLVASLGQALGPLALGLAPRAASGEGLTRLALVMVGAATVLLGLTLTNRLAPPVARDAGHEPSNVRRLLAIKGLKPAVLASAVILSAVDLTVIYLPVIGVERGLGAGLVGLLLGLRAVASMVSRFSISRIVARIGRTRFMVTSVLLAGVTLVLTAVPMPLPALGVVMVLMGLGLGVGQPLTLAWLSSVAPAPDRGLALALRLTGNRIGQLVVPAGVGAVTPVWGAGAVFLITGVAVGSLALLFGGDDLETLAAE